MRWWQGASLDEVSAGPARVALARPCRTPRERPKPSQRDDPLPTAQACAVAASTLPAGAQTRKSVKFEGEERWAGKDRDPLRSSSPAWRTSTIASSRDDGVLTSLPAGYVV